MKKKVLIGMAALLIGGASFLNFGSVSKAGAEAIWPPEKKLIHIVAKVKGSIEGYEVDCTKPGAIICDVDVFIDVEC